MRVSVLIPTFRRPDSFLRAALSVFAQNGVSEFELIAVDNSPEGSALETFRKLETTAPIPFLYAHDPNPGVANARNAALALARGDLVAWLDDDEEASPYWLAALVAQRRATGAQSVFGPVAARAPAKTPHAAFYERLYSRTGPATNAARTRAWGIGNSLQPRAMFADALPFDARANETGGEDDLLFAAWAVAGATFAWASEALVVEHIDSARTQFAHGLRRAFAYGQAPCETAWADCDALRLLRHMSIGTAQMLAFGAAAAVVAPASSAHALHLLDRAARGAGKVFWFRPQRFYGATLVKQAA